LKHVEAEIGERRTNGPSCHMSIADYYNRVVGATYVVQDDLSAWSQEIGDAIHKWAILLPNISLSFARAHDSKWV
jgi:hypothetical protein